MPLSRRSIPVLLTAFAAAAAPFLAAPAASAATLAPATAGVHGEYCAQHALARDTRGHIGVVTSRLCLKVSDDTVVPGISTFCLSWGHKYGAGYYPTWCDVSQTGYKLTPPKGKAHTGELGYSEGWEWTSYGVSGVKCATGRWELTTTGSTTTLGSPAAAFDTAQAQAIDITSCR